MDEPRAFTFSLRETVLFLIGEAIIAIVLTLDCFGWHIRSKGPPGWWDYATALAAWAVVFSTARRLKVQLQERRASAQGDRGAHAWQIDPAASSS